MSADQVGEGVGVPPYIKIGDSSRLVPMDQKGLPAKY